MARKKIKVKGGQHILIRAVTGPNFEGVGNNALKDIRKIEKRISTHPVLKRFVR